MIRIAKETDLKKIEELKKKIDDEIYLKLAIKRIAHDITENMMEED